MAILDCAGGIGDEKTKNLTGSSSLLTLKNGIKIMIDFGAYQGTDNDDKYNSQINKDLLDADYLVLTHSHMDHGGRIPFLIKQGFKGKIIMTKVTMDTLMVMLYDALRINDRRIEEAKRIRASEEKKFNRYLRIIKLANDSRIGERNNSNNLSRIKVKGGGFSHK